MSDADPVTAMALSTIGTAMAHVGRYSVDQLNAQLECALKLTGEQTVYFIESRLTRLVKIGVTKNLQNRVAQIAGQTGSSISVLLKFPGNRFMESAFHGVFDEYRVRGEWFRRDGRLAEFIAERHR